MKRELFFCNLVSFRIAGCLMLILCILCAGGGILFLLVKGHLSRPTYLAASFLLFR